MKSTGQNENSGRFSCMENRIFEGACHGAARLSKPVLYLIALWLKLHMGTPWASRPVDGELLKSIKTEFPSFCKENVRSSRNYPSL